jgi:hypothetical protein
MRISPRLLAGLLLPALALGCQNGPVMCDVSGTVTLDGQPVPDGEIIFQAVNNDVTPDVGQIKGGGFNLRVRVGPKRVLILSSKKVPGKGLHGEDYILVRAIPPRYNDESILRADVSPQSDNKFTFDLTSKEKAR